MFIRGSQISQNLEATPKFNRQNDDTKQVPYRELQVWGAYVGKNKFARVMIFLHPWSSLTYQSTSTGVTATTDSSWPIFTHLPVYVYRCHCDNRQLLACLHSPTSLHLPVSHCYNWQLFAYLHSPTSLRLPVSHCDNRQLLAHPSGCAVKALICSRAIARVACSNLAMGSHVRPWFVVCCVDSGLCDGLITRSGEPHRLWLILV